MLLTISPFVADDWNGGGSAAAATKYKLTGNQAADIVGIAKSCQGMKLPATKKKLKTYGKALWNPGYSKDWCAWFVANCAKEAGVKASVIGHFTYADGHRGKIDGYENWARKKGLFRSKKYRPKPGDLALFSNGGHIEIVASVSSKGVVKTIGGNTGNNYYKYSTVSAPRSRGGLYGYIEIKYPSAKVSHTFSYNLNGGSGNTASQTAKDGATITLHGKPSYYGHTFLGYYANRRADATWYVAGHGWCKWTDIEKKHYTPKLYTAGGKYILDKSWTKGSPKSNYVFKAQYRNNTFTVRYNANGGTGTMADTKHTYDVKQNLSVNRFTRSGYNFSDWYAHRSSDNTWAYIKDGNIQWYAKGKQPAGYVLYKYKNGNWIAWTTAADKDVVTLYAQWDAIPKPETEPVTTPEPLDDEEYIDEDEEFIDDEDDTDDEDYIDEEDYIDDDEYIDDEEEYVDDTDESLDETAVTESTEPTTTEPVVASEPVYDWTAWSGFSTTRPEDQENRQIESRTEYRYRDKQIVKSGRDSLAGYTKESTQTSSPSYSKWLVGEQKPSTTVTDSKKTVVTVETKSTNLSYAWYCKCKKVCWKNSSGTCKYCGGKTNYGKLKIYSSKSLSQSGYKKDTDGSYFLPTTVKKSAPGKLGEIYCMKWQGNHIDSFTTASKVGNKNVFVWPDGKATLYRNKSVDYVNTFSKWGNWSAWSDSQINASGTRQVETRTVYRYRDWVEQ